MSSILKAILVIALQATSCLLLSIGITAHDWWIITIGTLGAGVSFYAVYAWQKEELLERQRRK